MQTLFILFDQATGVLNNVQTTNAANGVQFTNCPDDLISFPENYLIKNGQIVSIASSDFPYADRPYRVDIPFEKISDIVSNAQTFQLASNSVDAPKVKTAIGYTYWYKDLVVKDANGVLILSTNETISILKAQFNIDVKFNPILS